MGILYDRDFVESMTTRHVCMTGFDKKNLAPDDYDFKIAEVRIPDEDKIHKGGLVSAPLGECIQKLIVSLTSLNMRRL